MIEKGKINEEDVRKAYNFLAHKNQTEIRLITPTRSLPPKSIFVSNEEDFVETCKQYNGEYNVYVGINERSNNGTSAKDVISVKTIVIDIDSTRVGASSKEPATDKELRKAEEVADKIINEYKYSNPTKVMSGNGYHLYFAIPTIEVNDSNRDLVESKIKAFIDSLKAKYETDCAKIDQIGDLPRIIKIPGTLSIKGNNIEERPHRVSYACSEFKRIENPVIKDYILQMGTNKSQLNGLLERKVEADYWEILKNPNASEQHRCSAVVQVYHAHKTWNLNDAFDFIVKENEWEDFNPNQTFLKMQEVWKRYVPSQEEKSLSEKVLELLTIKQRTEATEILAKEFQNTNHVYTIRDDKFAESWVYSEGIYIPNGQTYIREFCRQILGKAFTKHIANEVISKVESDTFVNMKDFFEQENLEEIAVENGILNVTTKGLTQFTPNKIFFNKIPVTFDQTKRCPKIDGFLRQVLNDDRGKVMAIYELFGYLLYKKYSIQKAVMFIGGGRNGKSILLELQKRFIGAVNCSAIPIQQFENDDFSKIELHRKLANLSGDLDATTISKSGSFKGLTGGDIISASRKFKTRLEFVNYAKLIFATNNLPRTKDNSLAFFDRWVLFEFPITFLTKLEYDKLSEKEKKFAGIRKTSIIDEITNADELSGLLNVALSGLSNLLEQKDFTKSGSVTDVEKTWIRNSDSFRAFVREFIEEDLDSQITKRELKKEYQQFCQKYKLKKLGDKAIKEIFEDELSVYDNHLNYLTTGDSCWDGVRLKKEEIKILAK